MHLTQRCKHSNEIIFLVVFIEWFNNFSYCCQFINLSPLLPGSQSSKWIYFRRNITVKCLKANIHCKALCSLAIGRQKILNIHSSTIKETYGIQKSSMYSNFWNHCMFKCLQFTKVFISRRNFLNADIHVWSNTFNNIIVNKQIPTFSCFFNSSNYSW